jgi:hypothetical protein
MVAGFHWVQERAEERVEEKLVEHNDATRHFAGF